MEASEVVDLITWEIRRNLTLEKDYPFSGGTRIVLKYAGEVLDYITIEEAE